MRFAGETACATTGKSFAGIGGACFSLPIRAQLGRANSSCYLGVICFEQELSS